MKKYTWICKECGKEMKVESGCVPQMCCYCGSKNIHSDQLIRDRESLAALDNDLSGVEQQLHALKKQEAPLRIRRKEIVLKLRSMQARGIITQEELRQRVGRDNDGKSDKHAVKKPAVKKAKKEVANATV